jgi:5'-methylthioadenosine phosphorylase
MEGQNIPAADFAIIQGSGTFDITFPEDVNLAGISIEARRLEFQTPYGLSSQFKLVKGSGSHTDDGKDRYALTVPFHGWRPDADNRFASEQIYWVFRESGVKRVLVEGSVGSVNILLDPKDIVIPTDFIDFTKRTSPFFSGYGPILRMKQPTCPEIRKAFLKYCRDEGRARVFPRGVYGVTEVMEGPRFESPAEVRMLQILGADIVGQSLVPEVYLARAIGACYAGIYAISNYGEGIQDWEDEEFYGNYPDYGVFLGRVLLKTFLSLPTTDTGCKCSKYRSEVPEKFLGYLE